MKNDTKSEQEIPEESARKVEVYGLSDRAEVFKLEKVKVENIVTMDQVSRRRYSNEFVVIDGIKSPLFWRIETPPREVGDFIVYTAITREDIAYPGEFPERNSLIAFVNNQHETLTGVGTLKELQALDDKLFYQWRFLHGGEFVGMLTPTGINETGPVFDAITEGPKIQDEHVAYKGMVKRGRRQKIYSVSVSKKGDYVIRQVEEEKKKGFNFLRFLR